MPGKHQESAQALLAALNIDPAPGIYNNMGVLCMEKCAYTNAIWFFEKAIEAKTSYYPTAHDNLEKAKAAMRADPAQN